MKESAFKKSLIHIGLFIITLATTTLAGAEYRTGKAFLVNLEWGDWSSGLPYALSFLAFLTVHEFGHYFTAVYYKVKTTLPYFIPLYIPIFFANIGTMGAVIRLKSIPKSTRQFFDIGIAGPLAGFVISLGLLIYGFLNLPNLEEYVLNIHPEYLDDFGGIPSQEELEAYLSKNQGGALIIGSSLLFELLQVILPIDAAQLPPHFELMHYPYLFVGYITLFFTALNLLPIGQLDGGHVIYGMFGRKNAALISKVAVVILILVGGTGIPDLKSAGTEVIISNAIYLIFITFLFSKILGRERPVWLLGVIISVLIAQITAKWIFPELSGNLLWLLYSFISVQFIGLEHPPAALEHRVNRPRQILGWVAILIFILCFSPNPVDVIGLEGGGS